MCGIKKWLAILGAVVLLVCASQMLWGATDTGDGCPMGGGGGGGGDEYPWGQTTSRSGTGTVGVAGNGTVHTGAPASLRPIFIVRPAPMGGFYLIRVSVPAGVSAQTAVSGKKTGN